MGKIIEIDTSNIKQPEADNSIFKTRENFAESSDTGSEVTIIIQAYNGLQKTKNCVESLLKYTNDVDYDLWLIDNGSTDGTYDYFKSVSYEKKNILRLSENKGSPLPWAYLDMGMMSKYVCLVNNDLVLTKNWLKNMLTVMESDNRIGLVNPMSSNASNYQNPHLEFSDFEDMQEKAAIFNVSDPSKWQERIRILTLGTLFRKECLYAIGLPLFDVGFAHNFGDDDIAFRTRRAGYKVILAGDTWIHHDDEKMAGLSIERATEIQKDLDVGRENFKEKYFGLDAWYDVGEFAPEYVNALRRVEGETKVLGIDVLCGTALLDVKNGLRQLNVFNAECYAYTTDARYLIDLQTICGRSNVLSGNITGFSENYKPSTFTHVVMGRDFNTYPDPFKTIEAAERLLVPDGQLFFGMYNTVNFVNFANALGRTDARNPVHAINYTVEEVVERLQKKGFNIAFLGGRRFADSKYFVKEIVDTVHWAIEHLPVSDKQEALYRLYSERFLFSITKKSM